MENIPSTTPFTLATNFTPPFHSPLEPELLTGNQSSASCFIPQHFHPHKSIGTQLLPGLLQEGGQVSGFGFFPGVSFKSSDMSHLYYRYLLKTKGILEKVVDTQSGDQELAYQYMLLKVNKALNANKN